MPSELPELTQILFNTALQVAIEKHCYDTNGVTTIYILLSVHLGCAWVCFFPLSFAFSEMKLTSLKNP